MIPSLGHRIPGGEEPIADKIKTRNQCLRSPEARLVFWGTSRTLSHNGLPGHPSECLDSIDLHL